MKLPFEKIQREVIVKFDETGEFGKDPSERTVKESIDYSVVNIDKPKGPTSHQISEFTKNILKINKAGHSGTLDPAVTGCLPVALGRATRIVQVLLTAGKEYVGVMHLHSEVSEAKLRDTINSFVGKIIQLPPVKSAVKRRERVRKIYYFEILEIDGQDVLFRTGVQAGTYIRKLCLHPETEIICDNSLVLAKDFFVHPNLIYSMDNKKIKQKSSSETQKFSYKGKMVKIIMSSGIDFTVTPDHHMLVSSVDGYIMKQASQLKVSDYIVKSISCHLPENNPIIADLLDEEYLIDQKNIKEIVKKEFIKKYGSIRGMHRKLKLDRKAFLYNSNIAIPISHLKKAGVYEEIKSKISEFKTEKGIKIKLSKLNSDLMYLIGLIASDGNNTKEKGTKRYTRIKFHNMNKDLIDLFIKKYQKIFPNFNISKRVLKNNLIELDTSNSFLATICSNLGVKSPQKNSDLLSITYFNNKLIASFLRGYFDGDGTAYFKKKSNVKGINSNICYYSVNKTDTKRLHQMLLKLNISNKIFKKKEIYVVSINDIASKKRFISLVGSNHPFKKNKLKLIKQISSSELKDNLYIGLHHKKEIKSNKSKLHKMGGNLNRVLNSSIPITRGFYKKASKLVKLPSLDSFCIEKIKSIEKVNYKGYVYDMTVPDTHNFLIETGFVSSNCHDVGLRLEGAHMAELRRTKAGPFNDKNLTTLQDLADAFYYYKEGDEEKLKKVLLPLESAVEHLPKVWVRDSAIKSLCHGANVNLPGIAKLHKGINKHDIVAVMTLKGELIGYGKAVLSSKEMLDEKGLGINISKVFMLP